MTPQLELVADIVSDHMTAILPFFKPGAKITVAVRIPGNEDADFMLTSDEPAEAIALIQRRMAGSPS